MSEKLFIIPEVSLYNTLNNILTAIRVDYDNQTDKANSILYKIFNDLKDEKYDYYAEAVELFTNRDIDNPRRVEVRMFFDAERANIPTVHITMPADEMGENALSVDEDPTLSENTETGEVSPEYGRRFDSTFHVVCTSDNNREVLLMYHVIRAFTISAFDSFSLVGMENMKISGRELKITEDSVPTHIFARAISLKFSYELRIPRYLSRLAIDCVTIGAGTPIDPLSE